MFRLPLFARITLIVLIAASAGTAGARAQGLASPGTNSAGTAQSSGGTHHRKSEGATGTVLGTGHAAPTAESTDAAVRKENAILNRKLRGICSGC